MLPSHAVSELSRMAKFLTLIRRGFQIVCGVKCDVDIESNECDAGVKLANVE